MSNCDRKRGLTTIIANLKQQKFKAEGKLVIHVYFFFSLSKVSRVSSGRQAGEHSAHFRSQPCISAGRVLLSVLYSAFRRYHHAHRWPLMFLFLKKKKKGLCMVHITVITSSADVDVGRIFLLRLRVYVMRSCNFSFPVGFDLSCISARCYYSVLYRTIWKLELEMDVKIFQ